MQVSFFVCLCCFCLGHGGDGVCENFLFFFLTLTFVVAIVVDIILEKRADYFSKMLQTVPHYWEYVSEGVGYLYRFLKYVVKSKD